MATDFATLQAMVLGWSENEANSPTGIGIGWNDCRIFYLLMEMGICLHLCH